MILQELLDKPYKYELEEEDGNYIALFKDDTGELVTVSAEWWSGPNTYIVDFKRKDSFDLTGDTPKDKMIALRILSTVYDVLKHIVGEHKVLAIGFSSKSDEKSRVSLYDALVKRYASKLGYVKVEDTETVPNADFRSWARNVKRSWVGDYTRTWLIRKNAL